MEHIKYPSIDQFRHTIKEVQLFNQENPIIRFTGTVKLHGTNSAICYSREHGVYTQSRGRIITPEDDNYGFAKFVEENKKPIKDLMIGFFCVANCPLDSTLILYGEWCGQGIQSGVAVSTLDKMFVGFNMISVRKDEFTDKTIFLKNTKFSGENQLYNIYDFPTYTMDIDFDNPLLSQTGLVEITEAVEKECPVGKQFGVSGIGEGVVWTGKHNGNIYRFKVKGEKHSVSKVKTLAPVDIEKLNSIQEFIEYAVTENRLNQGIQEVFLSNNKPIEIKGMGDFIRWVNNDVFKEEQDTLDKNGLTRKDIGSPLATKARKWFNSYLDNL